METEAFKFWTDIFDTILLDSYKNERKELQKAAMLITALQLEIKNVQKNCEDEFSILREQLKRKDEIEEKVKSLPVEHNCVQNSNDNDDITELDNNISTQNCEEFSILREQLNWKNEIEEKVKPLSVEHNCVRNSNDNDDITELDNNISIQNSDLDTSDMFAFANNSSNKSSNSEVVDITLSEEDVTHLEKSPSLVSKRKHKSKRQTKKIYDDLKKNIFKEVDKENSMLVECTPEVEVKKRASNNGFLSKKTKKKAKKKSTLTQMFSDISKNTTNNQSEFDQNQTRNDDTTYLKEDNTELGISRLLSYINKDENENAVQNNDNSVEDEMDSAQAMDEFSKGILFDEESPIPSSPKKKFKPCESLVEPGLRGKAKKMSKEFSCAQTGNDDTTYLKEDNTELGISRLLSYINKDETENPVRNNDNSVEDEMDSAQDLDEFSKGILFDEESPIPGSPKKKFKPCESLVEPGLRGNAKKMLKGFSCAQCRYFYGAMKLSPKELQQKIDECSNHRYKYKPPEDTYAGIWDLTIPEEKVKRK